VAVLITLIIGIIIVNLFLFIGRWERRRIKYTAPDTSSQYTSLVDTFDKQNIEAFYDKICKLAARNSSPTARNIYFQAHQFVAKYQVGYSLLFYLHYLHVKTASADFRHRKISANLKKILFRNKQQEQKFAQICARLKENGELNRAIDDSKRLFPITRREIRLDTLAIRKADYEHAQTAELLGKYLEEDEPEILVGETIVYSSGLQEHNSYKDVFRLFEQHHFRINKKEMDTFARNKGLFRESLIQQINEAYYEMWEDVLIEDEGEAYTLNEIYYRQIKQ
jgi:hypothetical protein